MQIKATARVWLLALRPKTLWASISPVIIGTAMAYGDGGFHWLSALLAAVGAIMIQIGTNLANDYFDCLHGVDGEHRLGPLRVTQAGLISPRAIITGIVAAFFIATMAGVYLVWRCGWPLVIIGLCSIFFGIFYTAGPVPLGYVGLGDILVFLFFGLVAVGGTYYVQTLEINRTVLLAGFGPGLFSVAILSVNNLRDVDTDGRAGKKTLAVRFGETFVRMEYLLSVLFACLMPLILFFLSPGHPYSTLAGLLFFPAIPLIKTVFAEKQGPAYNNVLAGTGMLLFVYSIVFSLGWIL